MTHATGRDGSPRQWMLGLLVLATACGGRRALSPSEGGAGRSGAAAGSAGTSPAGVAGSSSGAAGAAGNFGSSGSAGASDGSETGGTGGAAGTVGTAGMVGTVGTAGTAGTVGAAGTVGTAGAPAPSLLQISPREALGRIAAVLWKQAPDEDLVQLAASIATTRHLQPLVRQIVSDPRSTIGVGEFFRWWLDLALLPTLEKDRSLFPEYTSDVRTNLAAEPEAFGVDVTVTLNDTFQTLMTAPFTWMNERIAGLYGVTGISGEELRRVPLPMFQRAGLLTQPAIQVLGSFEHRNSPSHQGSNILRTFFCRTIPAAPPNVPGLDPIPPGTTVRQALASSVSSATNCQPCHAAIDPAGLAFEAFDAIGRVRVTDNGLPVDTSGLRFISNFGATPTIINGPVDLANTIATAPDAEECYAQKWLEFVLGRDLTPSDAASLADVQTQFASSGFRLQELIVATLTSDSFLASTPP